MHICFAIVLYLQLMPVLALVGKVPTVSSVPVQRYYGGNEKYRESDIFIHKDNILYYIHVLGHFYHAQYTLCALWCFFLDVLKRHAGHACLTN